MQCGLCGRINGHMKDCPDRPITKSYHCCSICGEEIYEGDDYIENQDGEIRHCDCFLGIKELIEWLGYEIKTMRGEY